MKRITGRSLLLASALVVALTAVNLWLAYRNIDALHEASRDVAHTQTLIVRLERLFSLVQDAESGQRAYVITGDESYIEPYEQAVHSLPSELEEIDRLARVASEHRRQLAVVKRAIDAKMAQMGDVIAARRDEGFDAAQALVQSKAGKRAMALMRKEMDRLIGYETRLQRIREGVADRTYHIAIISSAAANLLAIGTIAAFLYMLWRHLLQRDAAESAIHEQREQFRTTLASIGDAVITTDTSGRVTFVNAVAESLTGWSNDAAVGRPMAEVFHIVNEVTRQPAENPVDKVLREGAIVGLANHTVLIAADGSERPIDNSAAPIRDRHGAMRGVVLVFRDVSERRAHADALARKAAMLETAIDAVVSMDHRGRIIEFNPAAEDMFGLQRDDVLGREMAEVIIPPKLRESHRQGLKRYLETGEVKILNQRLDLVAVRADGSEFPAEVAITRITGEGPAIFTGFIRDVTERKQAEEAVREAERQFRTLADSIPQLAWMADPDGAIFWYNQRWYDYSGTTFDEMKGWGWQSLHDPAELPRVIANFKESLASGEPWEDTFPIRRHDGAMRWHLSRALPVRDDHDRIVRWFGTNTDITEQREAANELRQLAADLSEADRRKDEFLATLAHELRNPLAPIRNALAMLDVTRGDPSAFDGTRAVMHRQVHHMARLIDDLIDVSRISRNMVELRKELVDLSDVVEQAIETTEPAFDAAAHKLVIHLPENPIVLEADPVRLAQVFSNLLANACKYTPSPGQITLTATRDDGVVEISVSDTGQGIDPQMLPHVFEMFTQGDRSPSRSQGGLGIGLTLVKRLVEAHGGEVRAASPGPGQGSTFTVRLPAASSEKPEAPPQRKPTADNAKRRILVVDDNRDSAMSLAMLLRLSGNETHTAYDGEEAVAVAAELQPDVILLDIGLPKLNGHEAAKRILQQPWSTRVVMVALTGWGQEDDRRKSKEAGFHHHLVKPVEHAALIELLNNSGTPSTES